MRTISCLSVVFLFACGARPLGSSDGNREESGLSPEANLDQCANGPLDAPVACTGAAWTNQNLNRNQAHYFEGDSVAYRLRFGKLETGTTVHVARIAWSTTVDGRHAIDYLTGFDRTEASADVC